MGSTTLFKRAVPVLAALDIEKAVLFYEQRLGFTARFQMPDYAGVTRGPSSRR